VETVTNQSRNTGLLSVFWFGMLFGRLIAANKVSTRFSQYTVTYFCIGISSVALVGAMMVNNPWQQGLLFWIVGTFFGPIYPMVMAIGGDLYPNRISVLSSGLSAAAISGSIFYPPLLGFLGERIELRTGMLGAACLGIPMALGLFVAKYYSKFST
jgi:fucose permease